jgi:hypothetical protein
VATINVDNEFTDFDEPIAETVIGWKGFTIAPSWAIGDLDLSAEFTDIDYNTNWQAWGDAETDPRQPSTRTSTPTPASARSATPMRPSRRRRRTSSSCGPSTCSTSVAAWTSSAR